MLGAQRNARELSQPVGLFVGQRSAAEHADRVGSVPLLHSDNAFESCLGWFTEFLARRRGRGFVCNGLICSCFGSPYSYVEHRARSRVRMRLERETADHFSTLLYFLEVHTTTLLFDPPT